MIQHQDIPWQTPCVVPVPQPKSTHQDAICEKYKPSAAIVAAPEGQPASPPIGYPGDEFEWMILL
jgi:hypothetical protein